ncbi:TadE/TadG family type IV pilus assembly protein [Fretibacter rubidus]|uniref:TadE/TadG family type IV pilus assembly protein n=1 Tax=Fretibacter rubidus TaxID=570162 RepID=UPI00352B64DE
MMKTTSLTSLTSLKTCFMRTAAAVKTKRFIKGFRDDTQGVAAIEFAFIAPVMLVMYFGLLEISMAVSADRKVSHSANVVGDLVTQLTVIDRAEMQDIMEATLAVMNVNPNSISNLTIEVSSYEMLNDGSNTRQRIGYARLGGPITRGAATYNPADIGNRLISVNSGAVVARVNYLHKPITAEFMKNVVLHETFMLKPRGVNPTVVFDDAGKNTFMCSVNGTTGRVGCTASTT